MENLKIKVNNEAESKEVQELFFELGYGKGACSAGNYPALIIAAIESRYQKTPYSSRATSLNHEAHSQYKEITLPELRALVSLHKNPINMDKVLSEVRSDALGLLEDKEYLRRNAGGTYSYVGTVHPDHVHDLMIEIPEGAIRATLCNDFLIFWKDDFLSLSVRNGDTDFTFEEDEDYGFVEYMDINDDAVVIWQRHTQPEELPFVDDASLNDQYAEIEQVRKEYKLKNDTTVDDYIDTLRCEDTVNHPSHNHYFIDVSDVDEVDFYEIALRYNVTDPCIQHILKKCLAVGNRGHKDFHTDLKDIYDTAARALRIHGG